MKRTSKETSPRAGVIEGGYLHDILAQPPALEETIATLDVPPVLQRLTRRLARGGYDRVVLTGMGSSFHGLHPLHLDLITQGFPARMVETSDLLYHQASLLRRRTLLVVVSQSGASVEIVRLLDRLTKGVDVIGVTNTPGSPLARRATTALFTRAGKEFSVSCKTYLAALAALTWLSGILRQKDLPALRTELGAAAPATARYLQDWRVHVTSLRSQLRGVRNVFFTGRGASLAAAGVAGLITKESTHLPAEGMSSAAFRHGPFEMLSPKTFVAVFLGDANTAALNARLAADVVRAGGRAAVIAAGAAAGPFCLPQAPECVRPILEMLPVEMITLALAANEGREAGKFVLASKITTIE